MQDFKLKTKADTAAKLLDLIRPLKPFYSPGKAWLKVGDLGVQYGEKVALMEGFTRILWGLGPLWSAQEDLPKEIQDEADEWFAQYMTGLTNGSNPEHEEYWGDIFDSDQKIVENAAIIMTIFLNKEKIWDALTPEQQNNLYKFMYQCNGKVMAPNNWRYFRIFANTMFKWLGLEADEEQLASDRALIESFYLDDGWYYDGWDTHVDYYVPFAMHFYSLIYSKVMNDVEPEFCQKLRDRSSQFSHDFLYWFGNDGNELGFGRSLTYRFAHSSFFGAMAVANVEGADWGTMRRLTLRNIETWCARPIFDNAGILTVGYGYPNIFMSERYSAAGSPYWALKTFMMLGVPSSHPFWTTPEKDAEFEPQKMFKHPRMIIAHEEDNHVLAYIAAQEHLTTKGQCAAKYEKFVYSNQFSFGVPREPDLIGGAYDNTFVVSYAGDDNYRMRHGIDKYDLTEDEIRMNYKIMPGVYVKSVVVPCGPWHVRFHEVETIHDIDVADGGFSLELEHCFKVVRGAPNGRYTLDQLKKGEGSVFAEFDWGVSGIVSLSGADAQWIDNTANTNLMYNLTGLPMACKTLAPGKHVLACCVFGDRTKNALEKAKDMPKVEMCNEKFTVSYKGKTTTHSFLD